jgi:hypothetical protein
MAAGEKPVSAKALGQGAKSDCKTVYPGQFRAWPPLLPGPGILQGLSRQGLTNAQDSWDGRSGSQGARPAPK